MYAIEIVSIIPNENSLNHAHMVQWYLLYNLLYSWHHEVVTDLLLLFYLNI